MKRFDAIVMFVSLWLLASMVIDVLTPNELTVYAIGAAIAPATAIAALGVTKLSEPMGAGAASHEAIPCRAPANSRSTRFSG